MTKRLTYAGTGVDRETRASAKECLKSLASTYSLSRYGEILTLPYNTLYPIGGFKYQTKCSDSVGTKVLLAQMAGKHDTIAIDGIAMVVNDCIRCGAQPIALTDTIDMRKSEPALLREIEKGLSRGACESDCPLVAGETADVPELINTSYNIICDCVGEVNKNEIIDGAKIAPGDAVVGLRSSGVHSNGISLLRRSLFRKWGGRYEGTEKPDGFARDVLSTCLEPTRIYVKQFFRARKDHDILGAVHITGDAYLKFGKLGAGFEFDNFEPQPVFGLIQEAGNIDDAEMFKTFNMGWGFGLVVRKQDADSVVQSLGSDAAVIGRVLPSKKIVIKHAGKEITLS